jgi:flavin prenyltransferase
MQRKIIIAVTGASGAIYAKMLFEKITGFERELAEVAVIFSTKACEIWNYELEEPFEAQLPFRNYGNNDFTAPFASGSSCFDTLIVCPCSMGTLGRIASGISEDLITRAADVMMKEHRRLILVPRETPYNLIHLKNMKKITLAGGIICPASPSFYSKPLTINALVETVIQRVLNLAGFESNSFKWGETSMASQPQKEM